MCYQNNNLWSAFKSLCYFHAEHMEPDNSNAGRWAASSRTSLSVWGLLPSAGCNISPLMTDLNSEACFQCLVVLLLLLCLQTVTPANLSFTHCLPEMLFEHSWSSETFLGVVSYVHAAKLLWGVGMFGSLVVCLHHCHSEMSPWGNNLDIEKLLTCLLNCCSALTWICCHP